MCASIWSSALSASMYSNFTDSSRSALTYALPSAESALAEFHRYHPKNYAFSPSILTSIGSLCFLQRTFNMIKLNVLWPMEASCIVKRLDQSSKAACDSRLRSLLLHAAIEAKWRLPAVNNCTLPPLSKYVLSCSSPNHMSCEISKSSQRWSFLISSTRSSWHSRFRYYANALRASERARGAESVQ